MAKSPLADSKTILSLKVLIGGKEIDEKFIVSEIEVERELNKVSKAKVVVLDGDPAKMDFEASESNSFEPGKEIDIQAGYGAATETIFKGIITKHRLRSRTASPSELVLTCSDKAIKMTLGRKNRYFEKSKDSDLIKKVVGEHGLQVSVKATTFEHPNLVQHYSTDWDFVMARAQMSGMIIENKDGKLTIEPPKVSGSPAVKLTYGTDIINFDVEVDSQAQMVNVKCVSWDAKTQKVIEGTSSEPSVNEQGNIKGKKLAEVLNVSDFQLQSPGAIPKPMLKIWADAELLKTRMARTRGSLEFQGNAKVYPNKLIELEGLGDRFNGSAYVSKVEHSIAEGIWLTRADFGISPNWFVDDHQTVTAAPASGTLPGMEGLQIGTVKKIDADPDGDTRIQVDIPMIEPSGVGVWARLGSNFYATKNAGSFFIPEVSDEVVLGFLNNDPRFPIILGMLYNKKNTPPLTPDKKNPIKAIITKNQLKLTFDDENKDIIIETPKGNKMTLSDKTGGITLEDNNKNKIVMDKSGVTIESAKDINFKAKANITVTANAKISMDAKADVAVSGLNIKNAAKVAFKAEGKAQAELSAAGQTTVKGAMVMIN